MSHDLIPALPHGLHHGGHEGTTLHTTALTRQLPTMNAGIPVTLTITGSEKAAAAVADFADTLTRRLNHARIEQQAARRMAYRLLDKQQADALRDLNFSAGDRLEFARRGEERMRPIAAELYVSPYMNGGAVVRFLDKAGHHHGGRDLIRLAGTHTGPDDPAARIAAAVEIAKRGFTNASTGRPAWTEHRTDTARIAIRPTAAYLDYVARQFGPVPDVPETDGLTAKATQRGWWEVNGAREPYWLTWSPALDGDKWTVWGGVPYPGMGVRPARLVIRTRDIAEALEAITSGK